MKKDSILEIQKLINCVGHNKPKSDTYNTTTQEAIVLYEIDEIAINNNFFYCDKKELSRTFKEFTGSVVNHLVYAYKIKLKNNKTKILEIIKKSIIKDIILYRQARRQTFVDIDTLLEQLEANGVAVEERKFIKINNNIYDYNNDRHRYRDFRAVQSFKKWLKNYIPCSIDCISVKKSGDKYKVSCSYPISIPYNIDRIRKLDVELYNIDATRHTYDRIYDLTNYKEKRMQRVKFELKKKKNILAG